MRLAAKVKLGFYPIPRAVLLLALRHLWIDGPTGNVTILDPCCGEGAALGMLSGKLEIPARNVFGIELEDGRAEKAKEALPGASIVGPCSYFASQVRPFRPFSMIFLNPPFDDEIGGGVREEQRFLERATYQIVSGGVLVMVCPERSFNYQLGAAIREHLDSYYEDVEVFVWPDGLRKYKELLIFGRRRDFSIGKRDDGFNPRWSNYWPGGWSDEPPLPLIGTTDHRWTVPAGLTPVVTKTDFTEAELFRAINASPLDAVLAPPAPKPKRQPPLSLGHGHRCLLLASGELNGLVYPDGEKPHIVRGTCRKERYLKDKTTSEDGKEVRETFAERIVLTIRAVGADGIIKTFEQ